MDSPKRRRYKDNPYSLIYEKDKDKYYILFRYSNNIINKVKVSLGIYDVFNCSELHDLKEMNEYDNHIEHLELNKESIYLRSINKPISIDDEDSMYKAILDFRSKQSFYTFEQLDSKNTKTYHDTVRVRFEMENI